MKFILNFILMVLFLLVFIGCASQNSGLWITDKNFVKSKIYDTAMANHKNDLGYTPLHYAAMNNAEISTLDYIIDFGVDANAINIMGNASLHLAAESNNLSAIEYLI